MTKNSHRVAPREFARDEMGSAMIEYSILIGLITAAVIAIIIAVGAWVGGEWEELEAALGLG